MGRAVGGASAVGCGVFGLGSLIIGVGLTVWLGSNVLSSTGGGSAKTTATTPSEQVQSLDSSLDELNTPPTPGLEPNGAAIVAPKEVATDQPASVSGTDLAPGPIDLTSCLAVTGSLTEVGACDASTTVTATVDAKGRLQVDYPIRRVITIDGTAYDCAARAGACSVFGHRPDNVLDTGLAAPLVFAAGLPPVDAAPPPEG